jgi:hypothetical protein
MVAMKGAKSVIDTYLRSSESDDRHKIFRISSVHRLVESCGFLMDRLAATRQKRCVAEADRQNVILKPSAAGQLR